MQKTFGKTAQTRLKSQRGEERLKNENNNTKEQIQYPQYSKPNEAGAKVWLLK